MATDLRTFPIGEFTVTLINAGDLRARLDEWFSFPEHERPARHAAAFTADVRVPMQCLHVAAPGASVLVDVPHYEIGPDTEYYLPGYQPPPGVLARLDELGSAPASIDHVVISHAHFDHYNGTTLLRDGAYEPAFPRARYHLGRGDWESPATREALADSASLQSRTLKILDARGLLSLVGPEGADLGAGIRIIAAPGESTGHQIVRVHSAGRTLYYLGDLFHHALEVDHPDLMVAWADAPAMLESRRALLAAALVEDALLVATHITGIGRLRRTAAGIRWEAAESVPA